MATQDNSFVKQSLTDTLTGPSTNSRLAHKPSQTKTTRRLINSKDMASRKAKADEESGGILKSLGLTPTNRRAHKTSATNQEAVTDWEQVDNLEAITEPTPYKAHQSSRQPLSSPSQHSTKPIQTDSTDSMQIKSHYQASPPSEPPNHQQSSSANSNESKIITNLRHQLAESTKAREELALQNNRLERELIELKGENKTRADTKVLGAREYQELERQFDEQEKLLSGYQRENERSLIELEATKVKMTKMSNLISKVYGPDWEETTLNINDGSPGGTIKQNSLPNRIHSSPSTINTTTNANNNIITTIPNAPSDKLSLQLAQVQLLVQGMERRLVSREAELEDLHKQTKLEHLSIQEHLNRTLPKLKSSK